MLKFHVYQCIFCIFFVGLDSHLLFRFPSVVVLDNKCGPCCQRCCWRVCVGGSPIYSQLKWPWTYYRNLQKPFAEESYLNLSIAIICIKWMLPLVMVIDCLRHDSRGFCWPHAVQGHCGAQRAPKRPSWYNHIYPNGVTMSATYSEELRGSCKELDLDLHWWSNHAKRTAIASKSAKAPTCCFM